MFPIWILLELRTKEVVATTEATSQIITNNKPTPNFLQAGCRSCHQTNSVKAPKGKKVISRPHGHARPKLTWWSFQPCP